MSMSLPPSLVKIEMQNRRSIRSTAVLYASARHLEAGCFGHSHQHCCNHGTSDSAVYRGEQRVDDHHDVTEQIRESVMDGIDAEQSEKADGRTSDESIRDRRRARARFERERVQEREGEISHRDRPLENRASEPTHRRSAVCRIKRPKRELEDQIA